MASQAKIFEIGPNMAFEPFIWYCQPVANGIWTKAMDSAFGSYTPCAIDSLVISISHLVLLRPVLLPNMADKEQSIVNRFHLRSNYYNYITINFCLYFNKYYCLLKKKKRSWGCHICFLNFF